MIEFSPERLRELRTALGVSAVELSRRLNVSAAQVHRLENGHRRLTVNTLLAYCNALDYAPRDLFRTSTKVAITGVIDSDFEIRPLPAGAVDTVAAPTLGKPTTSIAAVRWGAIGRFQPMSGHIVYYQRAHNSVPDNAWEKRCVITRGDGTRCLGWPVERDGQIHIDFGAGPGEFNVDISSASPVVAVMPPFAVALLGETDE